MTDLRKAAEQALRMLVDVEQYIRVRRIHPIIADDMAECAEILRAALAEPDEVAAAVAAEQQRLELKFAKDLYEQGMKNIARLNYELNQARREEREACAMLIESMHSPSSRWHAEAIRARSKP